MNSSLLLKSRDKSRDSTATRPQRQRSDDDDPNSYSFNGHICLLQTPHSEYMRTDAHIEYYGRFKWNRSTRAIKEGKMAFHFPDEWVRGFVREGKMFPLDTVRSLYFNASCQPKKVTSPNLSSILLSFKPSELNDMPIGTWPYGPTLWGGEFDAKEGHGKTEALVYPSRWEPPDFERNL